MWFCNMCLKTIKMAILWLSNHTSRNLISGNNNKGEQKFMSKDINLKMLLLLSKNARKRKKPKNSLNLKIKRMIKQCGISVRQIPCSY